MKFKGIYIAPVTPVKEDGSVNWKAGEKLLTFLLEKGVDGFCVGGGTSEYIHFSPEDRKEMFSAAAQIIPEGKKFFASIGASTFSEAMILGNHAVKLGADAVLLPMPHFFIYSQKDLEEFSRQISRALNIPVFLYNLPFFTNPLDFDTTVRLLEGEEMIVGLKDSSGEVDRFEPYVERFKHNSGKEITLFIGQDPYAYDALRVGWDSIISGLGSVCPELLVTLYRSFGKGDHETAARCQELIREMNPRIADLPIPWAIRFGLETRGIDCGPQSIPMSPERIEQKREFQQWFENWLEINSGVWENQE